MSDLSSTCYNFKLKPWVWKSPEANFNPNRNFARRIQGNKPNLPKYVTFTHVKYYTTFTLLYLVFTNGWKLTFQFLCIAKMLTYQWFVNLWRFSLKLFSLKLQKVFWKVLLLMIIIFMSEKSTFSRCCAKWLNSWQSEERNTWSHTMNVFLLT